MKRFMFLSVGVLCLALAVLIGFYVGSQRAEAQAPADVQYFVYDPGEGMGVNSNHYPRIVAILPTGETYMQQVGIEGHFELAPTMVGDFWNGAVSTQPSNWGKVKGNYNK